MKVYPFNALLRDANNMFQLWYSSKLDFWPSQHFSNFEVSISTTRLINFPIIIITFLWNVRNCLIKTPVSLYSIYYFSFKFLCFLKLSSLWNRQLSKVSLSELATSWPNVLSGHTRHQYRIWPMSSYDNTG